ncbi:hypothetical protein BCR34DRAFT_608415 [Clohesyomyces aquaticus]|uniref:Uncharacterized protein n=1 Tax=Clohesyomyces aquaticus TaxID=1231657 RepID=A0A1Y1Y7D8_9PLEO|nr:hypothetical protein BCR34DRAFT_608415 [Clohesyomyces aquaticus]
MFSKRLNNFLGLCTAAVIIHCGLTFLMAKFGIWQTYKWTGMFIAYAFGVDMLAFLMGLEEMLRALRGHRPLSSPVFLAWIFASRMLAGYTWFYFIDSIAAEDNIVLRAILALLTITFSTVLQHLGVLGGVGKGNAPVENVNTVVDDTSQSSKSEMLEMKTAFETTDSPYTLEQAIGMVAGVIMKGGDSETIPVDWKPSGPSTRRRR